MNIRWVSAGGPPAARWLGAYSTKQRRAGLEAAEDLQNASEGYYRKMPADYGLYNSINTATFAEAAQLDSAGSRKWSTPWASTADWTALPSTCTSWATCWAARAWPRCHMANAFATFAADGRYCAPIAILRVADRAGQPLPAQTSNAGTPWTGTWHAA